MLSCEKVKKKKRTFYLKTRWFTYLSKFKVYLYRSEIDECETGRNFIKGETKKNNMKLYMSIIAFLCYRSAKNDSIHYVSDMVLHICEWCQLGQIFFAFA